MKHRYRGPIVLAILGTLVPFGGSIVLMILSQRPQCPTGVAQAQIDAGTCIIGADMSGIWIILAIPIVLLLLLAAGVWALVLWRKR